MLTPRGRATNDEDDEFYEMEAMCIRITVYQLADDQVIRASDFL